MRPRISIRGSFRPFVGPSVRWSVSPSVGNAFFSSFEPRKIIGKDKEWVGEWSSRLNGKEQCRTISLLDNLSPRWTLYRTISLLDILSLSNNLTLRQSISRAISLSVKCNKCQTHRDTLGFSRSFVVFYDHLHSETPGDARSVHGRPLSKHLAPWHSSKWAILNECHVAKITWQWNKVLRIASSFPWIPCYHDIDLWMDEVTVNFVIM